jgi:FAD/FMN-containing dehydrogenase
VRHARRTFLQAVGIGAIMGDVAACTGRPGAEPPSSTPPAPPTTSTAPVPPDWAALRARLPGGLVLPGEPGYEDASHGFNTLFDGHRPAAVAACSRPEDVQACVDVAHNARIPIAARSGGHSYAGYSTPDGGLIADLATMSSVTVHPDGTAEVGAGTKLGEVYARLAAAGRAMPAGSCPSVGVAGLTLGGGIGVLARKFGLTCDRLVSARVVTADGQLRTASAESEPDLFWALRGGGGGNLGIVTSFTFATEPAPDLTVFSLRFPAGSGPNVVGAWQEWVAGLPDELWTLCGVTAGRPPTPRAVGCYVGPAGPLNSLLDNFIAKAAARPTSRMVQGKGFLDAMQHFAGGEPTRNGFVAGGLMIPTAVDSAKLTSTVDGRPPMDLLIDSWGGAISHISPTATAIPHRAALASIQIYINTTPATQPRASQTFTEVRDAITQLTGPHGYSNYMDPTLPNWASAYYGENLPRLKEITRKYDPDAVFAFAQSLTKA